MANDPAIPLATRAPPLPAKSNRRPVWIAAAASAGVLLACCLCLVPLGGYALWNRKPAPLEDKAAKIKKQDDDLAQFKQDALAAPPGVDGSIMFLPNDKITAPRLGSLRAHPWWTQPMTDAKIDKIIFAIAQLPIRQEVLYLRPDGEFSAHSDDPPGMKGKVCAVLVHNSSLEFNGASFIPAKLPTSRPAVISILSQGLDAAHLSSEMFRKTGKGFSGFEQFMEMGKIKGLENVPPLPPTPGPAIKAP